MAALAVTRAATSHDLFKRQYGRTLRWAALAALLVLTALILVLPEYRPTPYTLAEPREIVIREIAPVLPPLEKPTVAPPRAPVDVEPVPDDDPEALPTIEFPDPIGLPQPSTRWDAAADEPFVASSQKPRLIQGARADYPEMARLAGLQGLVMVKVLVGPDGRVLRVELLKGVHPLLDRPALAAARKLVFEPGRQREMPVSCWVAVPFRFRLD